MAEEKCKEHMNDGQRERKRGRDQKIYTKKESE